MGSISLPTHFTHDARSMPNLILAMLDPMVATENCHTEMFFLATGT